MVESYRVDFASWIETVVSRESTFRRWGKENFWNLIYLLNPAIASGTRQFIDKWWNFVLTYNLEKLRDDKGIRQFIEERERSLKKDLARIGNPNTKNAWGGESGSGQMDYRWWISQRLLSDILDGLEGGDA